jgi:hypothetical protein
VATTLQPEAVWKILLQGTKLNDSSTGLTAAQAQTGTDWYVDTSARIKKKPENMAKLRSYLLRMR